MFNKKKYSIKFRINKALLSLSFVLSLVFAFVLFLLLYVIEDHVFTNLLVAEDKHYSQLTSAQAKGWQPSSRQMKLVYSINQMPENLQSVVSSKTGVYEYFKNGQAYFILHGKNKKESSYYITFDVSKLLAVRDGRYGLIITIIAVTLLVMFIAILVSLGLSKRILSPLKRLTNQLLKHGLTEMRKGFSQPFAGDEVGVLASHLEVAIEQAQRAVQREFEFNSGVSHELRTPIQVATNSVELFELTHLDLKDNKALTRLKRAIVQMEQISEAFLWLASQRSVEKQLTNPAPVLDTLKQHYNQLYPNHILKVHIETNVNLQYLVPQAVFTVIIDNLLRNALQHGAADEVTINLSENYIQILNNKSEPNQSSFDSETQGYGIGLMIVKRICQRLDWNITFQEKNETHFETHIKF